MDAEGESILEAANAEDAPKIPQMAKDFKLPTKEELLEMLDSFKEMSAEEKEDLKKNILSGEFLKNMAGLGDSSAAQYYGYMKLVIFFSCIAVMILVFVFFGYKLYRSQTEKERKREEKRKQKMQKKKHK